MPSNVIETRWQERLCRYEDGIYFGTDEFVELRGRPSEGYYASVRAPIATLLADSPDGWTILDEVCSVSADDYLLYAGGTSWEGAGFVAVEHRISGRLLWLLHLSDVEKFTEISSDGPIVRTISKEYPFRCEWYIPIESPENLAVTQHR